MHLFPEPIVAPNQPVDLHVRVLRSPLAGRVTLTLVSDVAYFVFCGRTNWPMVPKYVAAHVSTAGSGAQTAEMGLFSTTSAPNKSALSFTKIEATGTIGNVTTGSGSTIVRNTSAFSTLIPAGTYLWAGIRTALASTQPTLTAVSLDHGEGYTQSTATAGALTGSGPWTGVIAGISLNATGPALNIELD